jgi:8-oxo-dGTP pyrophosphatase MutT (NUDIX family)
LRIDGSLNQFSTYDQLVAKLDAAVSAGVPGPDAQHLLAPVPRREWPRDFDPQRIREAAGLVLVFPIDHRPHIALTVRAEGLGRHSGQVSLPGGVIEPGESIAQTALREAYEEIALVPDQVRVIGELTPLDIPVSGFRLHPVVAAIDHRPALTPAEGEVAQILEVPLAQLVDPRHLRWTARTRGGAVLTVPGFHVLGHEIWGATAMVLAEFLVLVGWDGAVPRPGS